MDGAECGIINDACVSMRVCFDSLCFSSTQQRLADEEDATQLGQRRDNNAMTTTTATMSANLGTPGAIPIGVAGGQNATPPSSLSLSNAINNNATTNNSNNNNGTSVNQPSPSNHNVDGLRDIQELLRVKDERIEELESLVNQKDAEIQELRSHLDKFLSVLPFKSPLTPTKPRPRKQRAQGISAEPPLQLAQLLPYDKSDRFVILLGFVYRICIRETERERLEVKSDVQASRFRDAEHVILDSFLSSRRTVC